MISSSFSDASNASCNVNCFEPENLQRLYQKREESGVDEVSFDLSLLEGTSFLWIPILSQASGHSPFSTVLLFVLEATKGTKRVTRALIL